MIGRAAIVVTVATLAASSACNGPHVASAPTVPLSPAWPDTAADYATTHEAWTRTARILDEFDPVLDVSATFKAPQWRVAAVKRRIARQLLSDASAQAIIRDERAANDEFYEVELLVATYDHRLNDLQKNQRSVWRVALADDRGNEVTPASIKRDRRPERVIREEFPDLGPFHQAYIVKFPRTIDVLRDDARQFSLKVASAHGGVELVWRAP